jgi:hypothetical protein
LHGQLGAGSKAVRQLKPSFREALAIALAVYPEAWVDLDLAGAVLHPSPPAVPRSEAVALSFEVRTFLLEIQGPASAVTLRICR